MWLSWRHGLPLGTGIWGGEDAEFEPRRLRRTSRLSRFWPTTWKQSPSVPPSGTSFGSLHRRLRQQIVLRRLNTKHPPGKGPFAVRAAPVLSPWLPSVAPEGPVAVVVVSAAGSSASFPRGQEVGGGLRRASRSWAVRQLAAPCGLAVARRSTTTCCFPRSPSTLQPTGAGPAASNTGNEPPAACAFGRGPSCLRNPTTASYRYDGCTWLSHDVPPTYPSQREETNMCPTISQSVTRRAASFAAGSPAKLRPLFG